MARNELYPHTARYLAEQIEKYFAALDEDPTRRGGPSDFLAAVDMDFETAVAICNTDGTTYKSHRDLMRQAATRLRAHLETSPAWAGSAAVKSMFLCKQELWDGKAYTDKKESKVDANATVRVIFGDGKGTNGAFD